MYGYGTSGVSCGAWHGEFLDPVGFDVGAPGIGIILAYPTDAQLNWAVWKVG